jgi:hypothetical protein
MTAATESAERLSFGTTTSLSDTPDPYRQIRTLGLEKYAGELDEYGFTVVPPDLVAKRSLIEEIRTRVIALAAGEWGIPPEAVGPETTDVHRSFFRHNMVAEGECFEQILMNPTSLALITHLLGESCVLSSMGAFLKAPSHKTLELHTDNVAIPAPFPSYSQVANSTLCLSDYSYDDGSICFVPRSHKLGRHPLANEVNDLSLAVPVEAPAGSLIVFHGNTWHGAFGRRTPGYRMTLISYFTRMYLLRQEAVDYVTDEMRERNGTRFRQLMGDYLPYPFSVAGRDSMYRANAAGKYQHT